MTRSRKNKGSSSLMQRNAKYFFGTLLNSYKFHAQLIYWKIYKKHIIDNVMINHLTGLLNKCVLAFKRDNHLETSSRPWYFCVTNDEYIGDYPLQESYKL